MDRVQFWACYKNIIYFILYRDKNVRFGNVTYLKVFSKDQAAYKTFVEGGVMFGKKILTNSIEFYLNLPE